MKLLAFDTSTELMSIAVSRPDGDAARLWQHTGTGGAQASLGLIAAVMDLLLQADLALRDLDAICFGSGPGSFTGLRTACAVAQGLAYGAGVKVLPVNSLLALAEDARLNHLAAMDGSATLQLTALLDARMDEMYVASYAFAAGKWQDIEGAALCKPEALRLPPATPGATQALAGNVFATYGERLGGTPEGALRVQAMPTAAAMLRLAPQLLAAGLAVAPEHALPIYVRDKVAQTTAERAAIKAAQVAANAGTPTGATAA